MSDILAALLSLLIPLRHSKADRRMAKVLLLLLLLLLLLFLLPNDHPPEINPNWLSIVSLFSI